MELLALGVDLQGPTDSVVHSGLERLAGAVLVVEGLDAAVWEAVAAELVERVSPLEQVRPAVLAALLAALTALLIAMLVWLPDFDLANEQRLGLLLALCARFDIG